MACINMLHVLVISGSNAETDGGDWVAAECRSQMGGAKLWFFPSLCFWDVISSIIISTSIPFVPPQQSHRERAQVILETDGLTDNNYRAPLVCQTPTGRRDDGKVFVGWGHWCVETNWDSWVIWFRQWRKTKDFNLFRTELKNCIFFYLNNQSTFNQSWTAQLGEVCCEGMTTFISTLWDKWDWQTRTLKIHRQQLLKLWST